MNKKVVAVIPARMASSRYPGKPLAMIFDLPMIEHVRRRALLAKGIDEVVVATCDQAIVDVVTEAGGKAVMMHNARRRGNEPS
jgi:3-deoxy-manno-octulosonate cytidylyltransferase (CMP-KDO synthetase)